MKKISSFLIFCLIFLYFEFLFRLMMFNNFFDKSLINIILFCLIQALLCTIITSLLKKEIINKIISWVILLFWGLWFSMQFCVHNLFSFYFSFSLLGAAGQTLEFASDALNLMQKNILIIILFLIPLIAVVVFNKKIDFSKKERKITVRYVTYTLSMIGLFMLSLLIGKSADYSPYKLYFEKNNIALSVQKLGVMDSLFVDSVKFLTNFNENLSIDIDNVFDDDINKETKYEYNNLAIDFDKLISEESDEEIKNMHEYFKNQDGTLQNEYTNFFQNKNLILFMAESFNEIAVSKELTPTLYKLVNNGFVFNNFYTPTISSTIGGEFQELTGLYAASGFLSPWKGGNNSFPMGISTVFENLGYNTYAYHDNSYTFQSRFKYLEALGFDNFKGCGNGLESLINCKQWPESDVEMINATYVDYINSEKPFMTFYATVSGHGDYTWTAMSKKHQDAVKDLNYSSKVLAYIAANIELDQALETLINKLDESGKLNNTVIALVGDHYPYYLSVDEVNEASSYKKDAIVEINHSNFILWNNKMKKVEVNKVGSQIDVLPTIYNLFGVKYDSRLIIGNDILSSAPGLAMFGNRSWVSDYGTYYSSSGKFVLKNGKEISDEYIRIMNKDVSNRITMSSLIMSKDYYKKVLGD